MSGTEAGPRARRWCRGARRPRRTAGVATWPPSSRSDSIASRPGWTGRAPSPSAGVTASTRSNNCSRSPTKPTCASSSRFTPTRRLNGSARAIQIQVSSRIKVRASGHKRRRATASITRACAPIWCRSSAQRPPPPRATAPSTPSTFGASLIWSTGSGSTPRRNSVTARTRRRVFASGSNGNTRSSMPSMPPGIERFHRGTKSKRRASARSSRTPISSTGKPSSRTSSKKISS